MISMISRAMALVVLIGALGFVGFAVMLPQPADDAKTDAIVVLTGAPGRIARGLALLQAARAQRMLISGVDPRVKPRELALEQHAPLALFACCIDLGRQAIDTRSNGEETAHWLKDHHYRSVRLVTSDWHMRRARFELERVLGPGVAVVPDAVGGEVGLSELVREYRKFVVRRVAVLIGL